MTAAASTVDPSSFDVVVCGTGLPESVLAAACAAAGKTVLHVDPNPFYGSLFSSSVPPISVPSFLQLSSTPDSSDNTPCSSDAGVVPLQRRSSLYHGHGGIEASGTAPTPRRRAASPSIWWVPGCCTAPTSSFMDLLLRSGGGHHVEFKSVEILYWDHGDVYPVPGSKEDIFKDDTIKPVDKYHLHKFIKLVRSHIEGKASISEEELDLPFVEFLRKKELTPKMISVVLYAITMADYDQEDAATNSSENLLTTRDGIKTVGLHISSIGRFANAKSAFIYPMHGHGELPQAFCRFAAVKGALYVSRMPVTALLMDKERHHYIGVKLASGQDILCQQLILDPSYKIPSLDLPSDPKSQGKVARGICITRRPVKHDSSNVLVVFPPKSLQEQQVATLRVLQLSSSVAVCPIGMFIVHLSIPCADTVYGKALHQQSNRGSFRFHGSK